MHRAPRPLCALQKHTRGTHPNSFASVFLSRLINADIFDDVTKPLTLYFVCKSIPSIGPPITEIFTSLNHRAPRPGMTPELRLSRLRHFLLLAMPVVLRGGCVSDKGMMDSVIRDCGGGQGGRGGCVGFWDSFVGNE
jgi:hypothetical protein